MKAAIFAVGTELLFGQTVNTNAVYLSKELNIMGFDVLYHFTVGDNYERLRESVEYALKDCDILITTGGLGPTQDDLTKELLADMFDDQLVLHQPSLEHIKKLFDRMHFEMTENNIKQAYMPQNGIVLKNDQGTAPGCIFMNRGKYAICLPGPYREMISMFEKEVRRYLEKWNDGAIYYRLVRTFGIGESQMETELLDIIDGQSDPTVATYAKEGECYVRVASKRSTTEAAERAVFEMIEKVRERIGEFIYDIDNRDLPQVVGEKLIERSITICGGNRTHLARNQ